MICNICYETTDHDKTACLKAQQVLANKYQKDELTSKQKLALEFSFKKSRIYSKNIHENLLIKFIIMGYNESHLNNVINYIEHIAPINIHVNLDKTLAHLCNDTHYRNLFETTTTGGRNCLTSRTEWENVLFKGIYHDAEPFERVKYGALNITNDPAGIYCCRGYGDSFLVLKNNIKNRATFIFGDSSHKELHLSTFKHFKSVLYFIDEALLKTVIEIANNGEFNTQNYGMYIEVQIHGSLNLSRDVEMLMANGKHKSDLAMCGLLEQFSAQHGCPYSWIL